MDLVIKEFSLNPAMHKYEWKFPKLLMDVAMLLFCRGDLTSELAKETKRRLHQLHSTGITDP